MNGYMTALIVDCECHQPTGVCVYRGADDLVKTLTDEYDPDWAQGALQCATEITIPEDFEFGNGYFSDRDELRAAADRNLVEGGCCAPFVTVTTAGAVRVGDCDNDEEFLTVADALAYCRKAILTGNALNQAKAAAESDTRDNMAAEYYWHCDASLQIGALEAL